MKNLKVTTTILGLAFIALTVMACKDSKNGKNNNESTIEINHDHSVMNHDNMNTSNSVMDSDVQNSNTKQLLGDYMQLKDALVASNKEEAAKAGKKLENTLIAFSVTNYNSEQQNELKDIIEDAKEHAEHIGRSEIDHQREHFKILSKDIIDLVVITGTDTTLYQQFCPMYDKGSSWLSMSKDIKNPFYGSKMLACGRVEKQIN